MKNIIYVTLLSASSLLAEQSEYTNQIVQTFEINGSKIDNFLSNIDNSGTELAPSPIIGESIFELHTTHNESGESFLLDEHSTGSFNPKVSININSEDPNIYQNGQRYTRVGRPYSVNYTISGILPDSEVVEAQAVILEKQTTSFLSTNSSNTGFQTRSINNNGQGSETDNAQLGNAEKVQNIYAFYNNVAAGESFSTSIEQAQVTVFPNATGSISTITDENGSATPFGSNVGSYHKFPPIKVDIAGIYPGATVLLRVYPTSRSSSPADDIALVSTGTTDSFSNTFGQHEISEKLEVLNIVPTTTKTNYNIELIERSVYGDVTLSSASFALSKLVINAQLIGSE